MKIFFKTANLWLTHNVMYDEKNAIIYCRISSKQQQEGGGLSSQEVSCRRYCNENGYNILNVFSDVFTGWDLDRPWLKKLFQFIDDCEKNSGEKVSLLVVDDIDRIARDYGVHLEITKELKRRGIEYQSVKMKFENTPVGTFMEGTMALQAQFFRLQNKERVISRQEARLLDGYRPWYYPIGYKTEKAPTWGKILVKDEPNATYVQEALELYANDTLNSIVEVKTYLKSKWINLNRSTVGRMLNNILYTGMIEYKVNTYDKDGVLKKKRNIPLREGKHEGIISLETFKKIQRKLEGKRPYTHEKKFVNEEYPLRGYLVCSCCGLLLTGGKSRGKSGKQFPYYQFNRSCIHKWKSINANTLHAQFEQILQANTLPDSLVDMVKNHIQEEYNFKMRKKKNRLVQMKKELDILEVENNNIVDKIAITQSEFVLQRLEKKIETNLQKFKQLKEDIQNLEQTTDITDKIDLAFKVLANPHTIRKTETVENQQLLLGLVFSKKIPIDFSTKTYWTLPFNRLYLLSWAFLKSVSQDLKLQQDILNTPKLDLTDIENEINRFHYFGTLLNKANEPK